MGRDVNRPKVTSRHGSTQYGACYYCDAALPEGYDKHGPSRVAPTLVGGHGLTCNDCAREFNRVTKAFARQRQHWQHEKAWYEERDLPSPPFVFDPTGGVERRKRVRDWQRRIEENENAER